jgi:hypothetical protein
MKIRGTDCTDLRCKSSRCIGPRPKTCPPGCPKQKIIHMMPEQPYRDIHAASPPGGCLDCTRKEREQPSYHKPRPCPPGTKPILPKALDRNGTETFLDTFDCQEQPVGILGEDLFYHHTTSLNSVYLSSRDACSQIIALIVPSLCVSVEVIEPESYGSSTLRSQLSGFVQALCKPGQNDG